MPFFLLRGITSEIEVKAMKSSTTQMSQRHLEKYRKRTQFSDIMISGDPRLEESSTLKEKSTNPRCLCHSCCTYLPGNKNRESFSGAPKDVSMALELKKMDQQSI